MNIKRLLLLILLFSTPHLMAQEPASLVRIELKDGNTFVGQIQEEHEETLNLLTEHYGILLLNKSDIKSRIPLTDVQKTRNEYWLPNPQSTRYFWAPNGYGLKAGESYYQNIWVFYNQASVGLTDHFSVGAGMVPLFLFDGTPSPVWLVPKFSLPLVPGHLNLGAGAFLGTILGESKSGFGLLYATTTFGSTDRNFSMGLTYGYAGGEWLKAPVINLSGMERVGSRGYLITENYIITAQGEIGVILSFGGRTIIRNIGVDYSLIIPVIPDSNAFIAVPFLGLTVPIGKKR